MQSANSGISCPNEKISFRKTITLVAVNLKTLKNQQVKALCLCGNYPENNQKMVTKCEILNYIKLNG